MEMDFWLRTSFDKLVMERSVRVNEALARLQQERDAAHAALCATTGEDLPLEADLWPKPGWPPEAREQLETFARLWDCLAISSAEFMCAAVCKEDGVFLPDPGIERLKARGRALFRELSAALGERYNWLAVSRRFGLRRTPQEDALFWSIAERLRDFTALRMELDRLNAERGKRQMDRFFAAYGGSVPLTGIIFAWSSTSLC